MQSQLSLELLVYLSLAGLSFAFIFPSVVKTVAGIDQKILGFEVSQFVRYIDTRLMLGNSTFGVFVPKGICGYAIRDGLLLTRFGAFYFSWQVQSSDTTLCPDGASGYFRIARHDGTSFLERDN